MTEVLIQKVDERERIERLLRRQSKEVKDAFAAFLRDARSAEALRTVREALAGRGVQAALEIVDAHVRRFGAVFPRVFQEAGSNEASHLAGQVEGDLARLAITFDATNPRAAELMRRNRLEFVREFTRRQRDATRTALQQALREGAGVRDAARAFRDSIGLTRTQLAAVDNYERLLRQGSSDALSRQLRDRRFDPTVTRSVRTGEPLTGQQVRRMVGRYRERYLALRSETIARTETQRTVNQARNEALEQTVEQAEIPRDLVERVWFMTRDPRVRDHHFSMDGQTRGLNEPFISGLGNRLMFPSDPGAPAEDVINCRCVVVNRIRRTDQPVTL